ncbi:hypothetical protein [Gracilimonas mengyeensis]|uniref:Porin n=1 Tax=Gracilimonas mengyeensis TaxID=1302730 RepID=A0A521ANG5_9BACT|nr:hypothetical protein [Gracilimonas mengyeensis]SMO36364.1 hypothetical protein SAMN06265219_101271 [Gracilimonas mengyeensis]
MEHRHLLIALLFCLIPAFGLAQSSQDYGDDYSLEFVPDLWYNDVDGIRVGVRVRGEMEGSFNDGPHRLNAGLWLGTWFPDQPVSYYFSFTEPIPSISSFGSEGSLQLETSVRTGFSKHGLYFNKRWQFGFDELKYVEFRTGLSTEKMFDEEYRQFPEHWVFNVNQDLPLDSPTGPRPRVKEQIHLLNASLLLHQQNLLGTYSIDLDFKQQLNEKVLPSFTRFDAEITQQIVLGSGFKLDFRSFFGMANKDVPYQYSYLSSMQSMIGWLDHGLSRAKGTIPISMMNEGIVQFTGGPNLRGYLNQDVKALKSNAFIQGIGAGDYYLLNAVLSLNAELDYPNPLHKKLKSIPFLGDFLAMRSYMFYDVGTMPERRGGNLFDAQKSDAGAGFELSINIPDYLGKDRGLFIRYDIPFWLSHPGGGESHVEFRHLIGIGALISF